MPDRHPDEAGLDFLAPDTGLVERIRQGLQDHKARFGAGDPSTGHAPAQPGFCAATGEPSRPARVAPAPPAGFRGTQ